VLQRFRRKPRAVVAAAHFNGGVRAGRENLDPAARGRVLDGVVENREDGAFQLCRIARDSRGARSREIYFDHLRGRCAGNARTGFARCFAQIDARDLERAGVRASNGKKIADERLHAVGFLRNRRE